MQNGNNQNFYDHSKVQDECKYYIMVTHLENIVSHWKGILRTLCKYCL